jgi:hypothetical protein
MEKHSITRRRLLVTGGSGAVAGAWLGQGAAAEAASTKTGGKRLTVEVALTAFDSVRPAIPPTASPTGPYYAAGDIYSGGTLKPDGTPMAGAKKIGVYRCHGWLYDAATGANLAAQTLKLKGGDLTLIGYEPEVAAIAGGTGKYKTARGQGTVKETEHPAGLPSLSIALEIIG